MRRVLAIWALLCLLAIPVHAAAPGVTVTFTLQDSSGAGVAGQVVITLVNYGPLIPTVAGSGVIANLQYTANANASGVGSVTIYGNYQIGPPGTLYQVQVANAGGSMNLSGTYQFNNAGTFDLSTALPLTVIPPPQGLVPTNILIGNNTFSGTNNFNIVGITGALTTAGIANSGTLSTTGLLTASAGVTSPGPITFSDVVRTNKTCYVDGTTYTTVMGAYTDTSNCNAVKVPPGYSETVGASWTLNRAAVPIVFEGNASLNFGTNTIAVTAGTHGVTLEGVVASGSIPASSSKQVYFSYTGNGSFVTVGANSADTDGFRWRNIFMDLSAAGNASIGMNIIRTYECVVEHVRVLGNGAGATTQIGYKLDGTGNFTTCNMQDFNFSQTNIGLQLTGSGTNAANNGVFLNPITTGQSGTAPIAIDFEAQSGNNQVFGGNLNSPGIAVNFGGTSTVNTVDIQDQGTITKDVNFAAGSNGNLVWLSNTVTSVTDSGTNNSVIPTKGAYKWDALGNFTATGALHGNGGAVNSIVTGCNGTATSSQTMYMGAPGRATQTCTDTGASTLSFVMTSAGTLRNLFVNALTGGFNASSGVFTIRKNGVDSGVTCTTGTATTCSDTTHSISVVAGDGILIKYTTQATETLANVSVAFEKQ